MATREAESASPTVAFANACLAQAEQTSGHLTGAPKAETF
jgi:hypothetical protein